MLATWRRAEVGVVLVRHGLGLGELRGAVDACVLGGVEASAVLAEPRDQAVAQLPLRRIEADAGAGRLCVGSCKGLGGPGLMGGRPQNGCGWGGRLVLQQRSCLSRPESGKSYAATRVAPPTRPPQQIDHLGHLASGPKRRGGKTV